MHIQEVRNKLEIKLSCRPHLKNTSTTFILFIACRRGGHIFEGEREIFPQPIIDFDNLEPSLGIIENFDYFATFVIKFPSSIFSISLHF